MITSVPTVENCQYLVDTGYVRNTEHYWVKRQASILLVERTRLQPTDSLKLPAPLPQELEKDLPKVNIQQRGKQFYVTYRIAANQSMFQLKDTLADALAYMWIQLKERQTK